MNQNVPDKQVLTAVHLKSSPRGRKAARDILLIAITADISPEKKVQISRILDGPVDWQYLVNLADIHEVAPLIAHNILANGFTDRIPESYTEQLRKIYNTSLYRNIILSDELTRVLSIFNRSGISVISLKGIVLAEMLYNNLGLRDISDIDILVTPDDLPKAGSLLVEMGYKRSTSPSEETHPFHGAPYYKQGAILIHIELHWDLEDEKLQPITGQEIWNRAKRIQLPWGFALVLSPEDMLLFSTIQLYKHSTHLKVLGDIAELLRKYDDVLDWSYLVNTANSWGITAGVYYALKWAHSLLEAPIPPSVMKASKPKAWRRWVLEFLKDEESIVSPIQQEKLEEETSILVHSLVISQARRMAAVIAKHRGYGKRAVLLRAVFWMIIVFLTALGRNLARFIIEKRNR